MPLRKPMALKPVISLDFRHKKRRPWTSLDDEVVEPGAFELVFPRLYLLVLAACDIVGIHVGIHAKPR